MPFRAAFFDVGDTLVEHWAPRERMNERMRARVCEAVGELPWVDDLVGADLEPPVSTSLAVELAKGPAGVRLAPEWSRQETDRWFREWFERQGVATDGIDLERVRSAMCVPLEDVSTPVAGAYDALRWCARRGMRVVLVTNTLTRGDEDVLDDWRRVGLADAIHGVVSSHSAGWRKPHPAIFEQALRVADVAPSEAFHVGDNVIADVYGAKQVGLRAVWRRRRGLPADPRRRSERAGPGSDGCHHPSDALVLADGDVLCTECGRPIGVEVVPDASVADLTELPRVVERWSS